MDKITTQSNVFRALFSLFVLLAISFISNAQKFSFETKVVNRVYSTPHS